MVLYIGRGPQSMPAGGQRLLTARGRNAIELEHAIAAIGPVLAGGFGRGGAGRGAAPNAAGAAAGTAGGTTAGTTADARGGQPAAGQTAPGQNAAVQPQRGAGGGRGGANPNLGDFQTVQRLDTKVPPQITASDEFFDFIFSAAGQSYADVKAKADKQEPLPGVALDNVSITIDVDNDYDVVQTRLTRNVVGVIRGQRPAAARHLRPVRRALRSHRLSATPPGQGRGGGGGGAGAGRLRRAGARHAQARRRHQQRGGRRRLGDGVGHGDRPGVRHRAKAETLADVRLARG